MYFAVSYLTYQITHLTHAPREIRYPIVKAIHLKLTNDRRRFSKVIQPAFKVLFELLRKEKDLEKFLNDEGKGKPPPRFNAAVEVGLRTLGEISVSTSDLISNQHASLFQYTSQTMNVQDFGIKSIQQYL